MLDGGAGGHPDRHRKLVGHDHGQRGLAQTRRTGQQDVIRRDLAFAGGVQEQLQLGLQPWLPDEAVKNVGAQLLVADGLVADWRGGDHA